MTKTDIISKTLLSAALACGFGFLFWPVLPAQADSVGKRIEINLAKQRLSIYEDGKNLGTYVISSGKKSMPTPKGTFQIYYKTRMAWSAKYGLFMPYWMSFTPSGSHGIHELPEWPGGYKEGANHLGIPVSHGCVRLGVGPAKKVYYWADIGTPVVIK